MIAVPRRRLTELRLAAPRAPCACFLLGVAVLLAACDPDVGSRTPTPARGSGPTTGGDSNFAQHIAPLVFAHCAECHRPGQSAPFSLLSYDDVAAHAEQIVDVTKSRYMPPWLPAPGVNEFADARSLSEEEIATFARWVEAGTPPGDAADLPPTPRWPDGWALGEPDLVVRMPRAYTLGAEGPDEYRNFLLPHPVEERRWIRAWEFRPGNPRAVHHGGLRTDRTGVARYEEEKDPLPGFTGDTMGELQGLSGWFEGWNPGKIPFAGYPDMAWPLEEGTDLVLELHLARSGKEEVVRSEVGLYFADEPPRRFPIKIRLGRYDLDIPAGESRYVATDQFVLPVAVSVLAVSPHAHYLAQEMEADARLPDGTTRRLLHIPRWDFDWQGDYRYREPIRLPAGAEISMRYTYDNSEGNVRNPNQPPVRVVYGPNTTDEMCGLWLQVLPQDPGDFDDLRALVQGKDIGQRIKTLSKRIDANPDDAVNYELLATILLNLGKLEQAEALYRKALEHDPSYTIAHYNLGLTLQRRGQLREAYASLSRATELDPDHVEAWSTRGAVLVALGSPEKALVAFDEALRRDSAYSTAWAGRGGALAALGKRQAALDCLDRAVRLRPEDTPVVLARARFLNDWDQSERALEGLDQVLAQRPESAPLWDARARTLHRLGRVPEAFEAAAKAIDLGHEATRPLYETLQRETGGKR